MTAFEFMDTWRGKGADFDGYYGDQCVDLFNFYNRDVVGAPFIWCDGAADLWDNIPAKTDRYTRIANTPEGVPQAGDVVIWRANGLYTGPAGHVAIATGRGDARNFESFDQNWPEGSVPHEQWHDYNDVLGWFRPVPAPQPPVEVQTQTTTYTPPVTQEDAAPQPATAPQVSSNTTVADNSDLPHTTEDTPTVVESQDIIPVGPTMNLKTRLTSRKLWITIATVALLLLHNDVNQAVAVVLGYIGVQGYVDSVQ